MQTCILEGGVEASNDTVVSQVNLQAELAHIQAHVSTLRRLPPLPQSQALCPSPTPTPTPHSLYASEIGSDLDPPQPQHTPMDLTDFPFPSVQDVENQELQALAREFVSVYLPGVRFRPSTSSS
ncbi:hypothetical protein V6N12_054136 [Hibiscus sabdariffa]|uniref:Uncharacterized protein n=1 Tax=Hibiscus sabdariffa TaxID=183260 RepID=A0ABR2B7F4_9ROSI